MSTTVTKSNKNLTTQELSEMFRDELNTGHPIVVHIQDSKNPEYVAVFLAQQKTETNPVAALFLGFNGSIVRAVQTVSKEQIKKNEILQNMIQIGGKLEGFDIHVEDSTTPSYEGQRPKTRVQDGVEMVQCTSDGELVYRNLELIPAGTKDDVIISSRNWIANEQNVAFKALTGKVQNDNDN